MTFRVAALWSIVFGVFSCGEVTKSIGQEDAGTVPGTFSGTVMGRKLDVNSAIFVKYFYFPDKVGTALVLSDAPDLCNLMRANRKPRDANLMFANIFRLDANNVHLEPDVGSYRVTPQTQPATGEKTAMVDFDSWNSQCEDFLELENSHSISGLMTVDAIDHSPGGKMSGAFDVTFGTQQDKVTGTFSAHYCEVFWSDEVTPISCE